MKKMTVLIAVLLLACMLFGCAKYSEKDFLGKTSTQIVEEYGEFDCVSAPADADGIYRSCRCGYTVQKAQPGYLEQNPEILFFIYFDANGIAVDTSEGPRPGG